jgi:hypothetical protein
MFGLVLDFYLNGPSDPVKISVTAATSAAIDAISSIDPLTFAGAWSRSDLAPLHQKTIMNAQTGQPLSGHVCQILS